VRAMLRGDFPAENAAAMPADVTPLVAPVRRQLKDLEERLASLRGYL
jgi:hypothetical protein